MPYRISIAAPVPSFLFLLADSEVEHARMKVFQKSYRRYFSCRVTIGAEYLLWIDHPFVAVFIREKWLKSRIFFRDMFIRFVCIRCLGVTRISKNSLRNSAGKSFEVGQLRKQVVKSLPFIMNRRFKSFCAFGSLFLLKLFAKIGPNFDGSMDTA